jgi:hypothetical protein
VGPTYQLGAERRGCFPEMEVETGQGADAARGLAGPGEERNSPGRSGPARWAGLIPYKKIKRVLIFEFK